MIDHSRQRQLNYSFGNITHFTIFFILLFHKAIDSAVLDFCKQCRHVCQPTMDILKVAYGNSHNRY